VLQAQVNRQDLDALLPSLIRTYTSTDFKVAYEKLRNIAEANPGNSILNSFLADFALARPNSENASNAFKLWAKYLESMSIDELFKANMSEAILRNTFNSPRDKYPPIKEFLIRLGANAQENPNFMELMKNISESDHIRNAELVAEVYVELLKTPQRTKEAQKNIESFLNLKTHPVARLALLSKLSAEGVPPTDASVQAAIDLLDNAHPEVYRSINYLKYVSQVRPDLLAQHEQRLLTGIQSILMESAEGEVAVRASEFLILAPRWTQNKDSLSEAMKGLLQNQRSTVAHRAASEALRNWSTFDKEFFESIYDSGLDRLVNFFAAKKGHSISIKNCRAILQNR